MYGSGHQDRVGYALGLNARGDIGHIAEDVGFAARVLKQQVRMIIAEEVVARMQRGRGRGLQDGDIGRRETARGGSARNDLMRTLRGPIGNPKTDMTGCVIAGK